MQLAHRPDSPMQIGGLLQYERGDGDFVVDVRDHLARRLPATALSCRLVANPGHYDTDAWFDLAALDVDEVVQTVEQDGPMSRTALLELIAREAVRPLELDGRPPVRILLVDHVEGGRAAMFLLVPHAFVDGIGYQSIVRALSDPTPEPAALPPRSKLDEPVPDEVAWRAASDARFAADARGRVAVDRDAAKADLAAFVEDGHPPAVSPDLGDLSGPTSTERSYDELTLSLSRVRAVGRSLDGTVNDVFLAICGGAVRALLLESGRALPGLPAVALGSRSYRTPQDGELGNYIIPIRPTLGTDVADAVERFAAVRASARVERRRSELLEPLIASGADGPFGSHDRRARHARAGGGNDPRIGASVTLSNVPGPGEPLYLAGHLQVSNHPAPFLGTAKFLNITLRRYRDHLDLGVMTDAAKVADAGTISRLVETSLDELAGAAGLDRPS